MYRYFVAFFLLTISFQTFATDLFGFLFSPCEVKLGVPVGHEEGVLSILTPHGSIETFKVESVEGIAHYVLNESVFDLRDLSSSSASYLKKFEVKETDLKLRGFPYQFNDGTVFILDQNGARRVVGQEEIGRVNPLTLVKFSPKASTRKVPELALPEGSSSCTMNKKGILPVRYLADKIQILETINTWDKGFRDINDLSERSVFYPRPFLYDKHDRLGFIMFKTEGPSLNLLPIRYSFSNGEDFKFQGQTSFGGGFSSIGPRALPMNILATDLKFHFLHASFEGNIPAMGVGSSFYKNENEYIDFAFNNPKGTRGELIFNHLALVGVDYSYWGISFGPIFPTFFVQIGEEVREATPQKSLPLLRLTWTGEKVKFKLSGALGDLNATNELSKKSTVMNSVQFQEFADIYKIDFKFFRAGIDWDLSEDTLITTDVIWTQWDYRESTGGAALDFESTQTAVLSSIRRNFSRYVSLGLYTLWTKPEEKATYASQSEERSENQLKMGGTFEFLF